MKKIIATLTCGILLVMLTIIPAFAEGDTARLNEPNETAGAITLPEEENATEGVISGEETTEEIPEEQPTDTPEDITPEATEEIPEDTTELTTDSVPSETPEELPTDAPVETPTETPEVSSEDITLPSDFPSDVPEDIEEQAKTTTEMIVEWVQSHFDDITFALTMLLTILYHILNNKKITKRIATLNNNTVTITERSNESMKEARDTIMEYKQEMSNLLAEIRATAEEKKATDIALKNANETLMNARAANVELSNVLAELLVLANIPNAKKEELYARHRAAVSNLEVPDDSGT
jgi:transcriptional regulator